MLLASFACSPCHFGYTGRAIRHIGDYAAILLVDVRYTSTSGHSGPNAIPSGPASKLPEWIKARLVPVTGSFGEVHKLLHQFFKHNQQRSQANQTSENSN